VLSLDTSFTFVGLFSSFTKEEPSCLSRLALVDLAAYKINFKGFLKRLETKFEISHIYNRSL